MLIKEALIRQSIVHVTIIILMVCVTFFRSVNNGFVWDDYPVVVENSLYHGKESFFKVFLTEDTIKGLESPTGYYRPLTFLSFWIDSTIWGMNPSVFHATSLALHICVTIALYLFLCSLALDRLSALFTSLLFAVNPVVVETVCFISGGRNTLLCTLFVLLTLIMHRRENFAVTAILALCTAASKEQGLLLPALLVVHDRILCGAARSIKAYLPVVWAVVFFLLVKHGVIASAAGIPQVSPLSLFLSPELLLRYLAVCIIPVFQ